jgi:hypothetical protein
MIGHLIGLTLDGNRLLVGQQIAQCGVLRFSFSLPLDVSVDPVRFVLHHLLYQGQWRVVWRCEVNPFTIDQQADGSPCAAFEVECTGAPRQLHGVLFDTAHGGVRLFIVCCCKVGFLALGNGVG